MSAAERHATGVHFAQIREDGAVERRVFGHDAGTPARRVVAIASGGCVALSLLDDAVESVTAVDASPAQCWLVEVRKHAIAALERDAYLAFVGELPASDRASTYRRLRESLSPDARAYWDEHTQAIASGIDHCGTTERFYRFVVGSLTDSVVSRETIERLLAHDDTTEQLAFYREHVDGAAWRGAVHALLSRMSHLAFFPAEMFANARVRSFGDHFLAQFERMLARHPLSKSYFAHQLLRGTYAVERDDALPWHLTHEGYARVRRNIDKLDVVHASIGNHLDAERDVDAFALSNVFDWGTAEQNVSLASTIRRAASPDARLVARFMLSDAALPHALAKSIRLGTEPAVAALEDRSALYRALYAGVLA